jgi:oxygen-independent coproporphyrinogen-3 oxidase
MPGIYVHLPFCKVHCSYCDFPLTTRLSLANEYYKCLLQEIVQQQAPPSDTLYFGGGTPSLTPGPVLLKVRNSFELLAGSEITLEANPDDVQTDRLAEWRAAGVNRLSLGIQSLEPEALRAALRQHTKEEAVAAIHQARAAGFENVNIDLILGLPRQTPNGMLQGMEELLLLRPQHVSLYFLEVHDSTALHTQIERGKAVIMAEDDQLECYERAVAMLQSAGYLHYEVSNFALPGYESRHNLKYWTSAPYYAYGAGACSYHDSVRTQNLASVSDYIRAMRAGQGSVAASTPEDAETRMRNTLIFGLRRQEGVAIAEFERHYGVVPLLLFPDADDLISGGMLEVAKGRLRLTFRGMLLSNEILSRLV